MIFRHKIYSLPDDELALMLYIFGDEKISIESNIQFICMLRLNSYTKRKILSTKDLLKDEYKGLPDQILNKLIN